MPSEHKEDKNMTNGTDPGNMNGEERMAEVSMLLSMAIRHSAESTGWLATSPISWPATSKTITTRSRVRSGPSTRAVSFTITSGMTWPRYCMTRRPPTVSTSLGAIFSTRATSSSGTSAMGTSAATTRVINRNTRYSEC